MKKVLFASLIALMSATFSDARELKPETLRAWDAYVHAVEANMVDRTTGNAPFLWVDEAPGLSEQARSGDALVTTYGLAEVPHGLIHHWVGTIFIPGVTLDEMLRVLGDYNQYANVYHPIVVKSKLDEQESDSEEVTIEMMQKAFSVTAAVQCKEEVQISRLDTNRVQIVSNSVHVQEIANYGRDDERLLPEDEGPGYMYRTLTITRLEARDQGVYLEMETVALSRGIPFAFRWLVKPLTEKVPRNIMFEMLVDTGAAVRQEAGLPAEQNVELSNVRMKSAAR